MSARNVIVVAGLIWRGGKFLAAQRPGDKPMAGYWEIPGGKVEQGESMQAALRRELREELSIDALKMIFREKTTHDYEEASLRVEINFYDVMEFTGEPHAQEGQNLRWLTAGEALEMSFLPADQAFLARLR